MTRRIPFGEAAATLLIVTSLGLAADPPTVKQTMAFTPRQKDVDYEIPAADQLAKCKVDREERGKSVGWVVFGPEGQVLRRFVDSDGDGQVDQWRYFNQGIEVYRDIDSNKNNKPDQYRWLNFGGSRWGIDSDEDGHVDSWKSLSAAEASREAIRAVTAGDDAALMILLISADDLKSLGIEKQIAAKILESVHAAPKKAKAELQKSKILTPHSKWMRFDAQTPGTIPADDGKSKVDLQVYENAMAIVENGKQSNLVQIGEMVRIGEVWKLTQAPLPIDEKTILAGGFLMQPVVAENVAVGSNASPELQKLLDELQKWDEKPPTPPTSSSKDALTRYQEALTKYNSGRADLLMKIYKLADSEDEKSQWMKQMIDGLSATVQTGAYPEGLDRLKSLETELRKNGSKPLIAYVTYQRILSEYAVELPKAPEKQRSEVMAAWLKSLEDFVADYPQAEHVPDAMLHLAMNDEFMGKSKEAMEWYHKIVEDRPKTAAAAKAKGAITRLNLKGKPVAIAGPGLTGGTVSTASYSGKAVLVVFWATWSPQFAEELPELRALYQQYQKHFEIIGVSLDMAKDPIAPYLAQQKVAWPQIYQPGGMDSPLAIQFGIFSPQVMILIDADGRVVSRSASIAELKTVLPQLVKGK